MIGSSNGPEMDANGLADVGLASASSEGARAPERPSRGQRGVSRISRSDRGEALSSRFGVTQQRYHNDLWTKRNTPNGVFADTGRQSLGVKRVYGLSICGFLVGRRLHFRLAMGFWCPHTHWYKGQIVEWGRKVYECGHCGTVRVR